MRRLLVAVLVVLLVIAAIAALAPASLVDAVIADRTRGQLHLVDAAGTLRSGRGVLSDTSGTLRLPVAWRVGLLPLLHGEVEIAFDSEGDATRPRGVIARRDGDLIATNLDLRVPAATLRALLPSTAPSLGGEFHLSSPELKWSDRGPSGRIDIDWSQASVAVADGTIALGDVRVAAAPQGPALHGRFDNRGGDVTMRGEFTLGDTTDVSASLAPVPGAPPEVVRALAALGQPDANGMVRVAWHGRVR